MTDPVPTPTADEPDSELPEQRVAITVFATVRAVDLSDAGFIAEAAIRRALLEVHRRDQEGLVVMSPMRRGGVPVRIHKLMETGMAAGNGYLWTQLTPKAYRESE